MKWKADATRLLPGPYPITIPFSPLTDGRRVGCGGGVGWGGLLKGDERWRGDAFAGFRVTAGRLGVFSQNPAGGLESSPAQRERERGIERRRERERKEPVGYILYQSTRRSRVGAKGAK